MLKKLIITQKFNSQIQGNMHNINGNIIKKLNFLIDYFS